MSALAAGTIEALLREGIAVRFQARGGSMDPLIRDDDHLIVEPVRAAQVAPGDVVLASAARGLTAHRVIGIDAERIVMRGDNTPAADAPISHDQLLGRVTGLERDGRQHAVRRVGRRVLPIARGWVRAVRRLQQRFQTRE